MFSAYIDEMIKINTAPEVRSYRGKYRENKDEWEKLVAIYALSCILFTLVAISLSWALY